MGLIEELKEAKHQVDCENLLKADMEKDLEAYDVITRRQEIRERCRRNGIYNEIDRIDQKTETNFSCLVLLAIAFLFFIML